MNHSARENFSQMTLTGNQVKISGDDRMVGSIPPQLVKEKVQLAAGYTSYSMVVVLVQKAKEKLDIMTLLQQTISSWSTQM